MRLPFPDRDSIAARTSPISLTPRSYAGRLLRVTSEMSDTAAVNDEFQFGERAKRPARLGTASPRRAGASVNPRLVVLAVGLVVAAALAFVFLRGADEAGTQFGDANERAVSQVDKANDAAAQGSLGRAVVVARSLYAEEGTYPTDPATLSAYDPGLRFTQGVSNGPTSVSFAVGGSGFGAA